MNVDCNPKLVKIVYAIAGFKHRNYHAYCRSFREKMSQTVAKRLAAVMKVKEGYSYRKVAGMLKTTVDFMQHWVE